MRYEKLSPILGVAADDYARNGQRALSVHQTHLGLVSVDDTPKPPRVVVFVHPRKGADLDHLSALGVELNGGAPRGGVRTGIATFDALDRLSEDRAVRRIVPAQRMRLLMDKARTAVKVPGFRRSTKLSGKGVIVGVVDTGIEVTHPDFAGRALRLWDQTLNGPGVPEGGYGVELSGPAMDQSRDTAGHGTHVSGIAAGADATFLGVAPEASLVVVKSDLFDAHIADGVRYVFRLAAELGMPAVVNLSLGAQADAHDGTDSLSAIIDEAVGPGRIVCCAAGNEGNFNIHAQVLMRTDRTRTIACAMARRGPSDPAFVAAYTGWYPAEDSLQVAVVAPSDVQTPFQSVIRSGNPVKEYTLPEGAVRISTPGPDQANGDQNFVVLIEPMAPTGTPSATGAWRLRLNGKKISDGTVHVWSLDERVSQFTGPTVVDSMKIGSPGAAGEAITVASYTTKVQWEDIFGNARVAGLELDDLSDFSSEGPLRDGAEKPDLAAPGAMIGSAISAHAGNTPESLLDALHGIKSGTSMASPFVAGLVALLLERDPDLDPAGVKKRLRNASLIPGSPAGSFNPKWGYGLIDARKL